MFSAVARSVAMILWFCYGSCRICRRPAAVEVTADTRAATGRTMTLPVALSAPQEARTAVSVSCPLTAVSRLSRRNSTWVVALRRPGPPPSTPDIRPPLIGIHVALYIQLYSLNNSHIKKTTKNNQIILASVGQVYPTND